MGVTHGCDPGWHDDLQCNPKAGSHSLISTLALRGGRHISQVLQATKTHQSTHSTKQVCCPSTAGWLGSLSRPLSAARASLSSGMTLMAVMSASTACRKINKFK
ncbi:hypothetical protein E2C01_006315 [Portunus trituberculatus]|uniref:Uncharacterized protein n=1 Tax=Portunus trituberculatus TaxID=210409 RepID=A0A5B7CZ00_PORTR|nr:hypothetical protein [Portunus trituberculatus]